MSGGPRVGVVIPVYDGERYLAEAIESVLAQSVAAHDVVVVDDGSSDGSRAVADGYAPLVRCVRQEHAGIGRARNRGVEEVKGDVLAFLDADDVWTPRKLELQLAALEAGADLVFGLVEQFVSPDVDGETAERLFCSEGLRPAHLPGALLVRREVFQRVGPFPAERAVSEFLDWLLRARELGLREAVPPALVLRRRLHGRNNSLRRRAEIGEYARVLKEAIDRRRSPGRP